MAVVTASTKRQRIENYLTAASINLAPSDIQDIDEAGRQTMLMRSTVKREGRLQLVSKYAAVLGLVAVAAWKAGSYL